jgi:hypothetical protein
MRTRRDMGIFSKGEHDMWTSKTHLDPISNEIDKLAKLSSSTCILRVRARTSKAFKRVQDHARNGYIAIVNVMDHRTTVYIESIGSTRISTRPSPNNGQKTQTP